MVSGGSVTSGLGFSGFKSREFWGVGIRTRVCRGSGIFWAGLQVHEVSHGVGGPAENSQHPKGSKTLSESAPL